MMETQGASKRIALYLVLVFALSTVFYILIVRSGGLAGAGQLYVLPLMWAPAVAALVTTFVFQRNLRGLGWGFGKPVYYLIAYLLPLFYAGLVYGLVWLLGLGAVDTSALGAKLGPSLLKTLTVGVLGALLLALGEEIGWRGLLVPQLARLHPFGRAALISGVIWGVWHVPLIIGGGYSSAAPAWYAVACFMFLVVGVSFPFAWLRLVSGSIWPVALMHAVHNVVIQSVLDVITVDTGPTKFLTTEFGLGLAIMGVLVGLVFWRIGVPEGQMRTQPAVLSQPQRNPE